MVGDLELFLRIALEIRIFGNRNVRRVKKHEVTWFGVFGKHGGIVAADNCGILERFGSFTQGLNVADFRVLVFSEWSIELSLAIDSIQAVETGLVQVDRSRRSFYRRQFCPIQRANLEKLLSLVLVSSENSDHFFDMIPHLCI